MYNHETSIKTNTLACYRNLKKRRRKHNNGIIIKKRTVDKVVQEKVNGNLDKLKQHFYYYYKTKTRTQPYGSYRYALSGCHSQWMSVFNVNTDPQNKMCNELKDKAMKLFSQKEDDRGICYADKYNIWYNVDIRSRIGRAYTKYQSLIEKDNSKQRQTYSEAKLELRKLV